MAARARLGGEVMHVFADAADVRVVVFRDDGDTKSTSVRYCRCISRDTTEAGHVPPGPRDIWLWMITIVDDVLVEKFWYRLRRGDARGAARAIWELVIGFPGCWLGLIALVALALVLVRLV
jgi:hypothetical protein